MSEACKALPVSDADDSPPGGHGLLSSHEHRATLVGSASLRSEALALSTAWRGLVPTPPLNPELLEAEPIS